MAPPLAAIDVGSNTLRLSIGRFAGDKLFDIYSDRRVTRLGSMVDQTGILQPERIDASLLALRAFADSVRRYGARSVKAVGTSALREARNAQVFIDAVKRETGIEIEIISGEKEAQLTLRGILLSLPSFVSRSAPLFIIDIGGGSTEVIVYREGEQPLVGSLPMGVIKLVQKCITTDPISESDFRNMGYAIDDALKKIDSRVKKRVTEAAWCIGTAGTFSTIASVDLGLERYSRERIHLHRIPLSRLLELEQMLVPLTLSERKQIRGLEPERADLILPGIHFTMKVMEMFGFRELIVSDYGLLEGALLELKDTHEKSVPETEES